jgi:hypothetical protein
MSELKLYIFEVLDHYTDHITILAQDEQRAREIFYRESGFTHYTSLTIKLIEREGIV